MNRLERIFRAARVRRWHTNADLAHTVDTLDGHQGRVARLILALHPDPSPRLVKMALTHDDGEHVTGDIAPTAKRRLGIKVALDELERKVRCEMWGPEYSDASDARWLHFADRLDAWMWVRHYAAPVLDSEDWPEATQWLRCEAQALDADEAVTLLAGVEVVG